MLIINQFKDPKWLPTALWTNPKFNNPNNPKLSMLNLPKWFMLNPLKWFMVNLLKWFMATPNKSKWFPKNNPNKLFNLKMSKEAKLSNEISLYNYLFFIN